ncbi:hypothetical protein Bca52824_014717 [Brassica carinata]|uniref:Uncharacterized protein n=1 Tax=Brassica carinata TaxID=52824 RepID=A0A8X8B2K7_BRACI|nr:hypothetical protein Bca52824_014717 [Brassica carinata]
MSRQRGAPGARQGAHGSAWRQAHMGAGETAPGPASVAGYRGARRECPASLEPAACECRRRQITHGAEQCPPARRTRPCDGITLARERSVVDAAAPCQRQASRRRQAGMPPGAGNPAWPIAAGARAKSYAGASGMRGASPQRGATVPPAKSVPPASQPGGRKAAGRQVGCRRQVPSATEGRARSAPAARPAHMTERWFAHPRRCRRCRSAVEEELDCLRSQYAEEVANAPRLVHEQSVLKICDVTEMVTFVTCRISQGRSHFSAEVRRCWEHKYNLL